MMLMAEKTARILTLVEEHLQGGVNYGGHMYDVEDDLKRAMSDPDIVQWLDKVRAEYEIVKRA
jgi:hypothetical protein